MATVSRSTKVSGGTTLGSSTLARAVDVETDMLTLFNAHNNHDSGASVWTVTNTTLLKAADGAVGSPAICFTNGTTDGIYRIGTNNYGFATNGVKRMDLSTTALTMTVPIAMGSNKITGLTNGSVSSDAAAFGQVPVFTDWASYTPSTAGLGTVSAVNFFWMQMGNHIFVKGFLTFGTVSAASATISVPSGKTISLTKTGTNWMLGFGQRLITGASTLRVAADTITVFSDGADTANVYLSNHAGSNAISKDNGSTMFNAGESLSVTFDYAI